VRQAAIDSWLEVTARRMDLPLGAVARAGPSHRYATSWIRWLSPDRLDVVEAATGVSSSVVEAFTLSVYDGTALQLDPNSHRLDATFPFGALSRSRFCPECLRESDGRWQLAWRLGWSFMCVLHNCLLADACSTCGKYQRRQQVYRRVPTPTMCVCGDMLGAAETVKLPTDHLIVDAQRQVLDVINEGDVSFGVFTVGGPGPRRFVANRSSVRDVLVAARSLANRVLNYASTHGLAPL